MMQFEQAPFPPGAPPWETLPPQVTVIIAVAVIAGAVLIFGPLLRAMARRIEGVGGSKAVRNELEELRHRLEAVEQQAITGGEVDASLQRLDEVEERLEFMERVISTGTEGNGA